MFCPSLVPLWRWDSLWLTSRRRAGLLDENWPAQNRTALLTSDQYGAGETGQGILTMTAQELLARISDYCRQTGLAESTFGRRAVNDGKLANRLRNGGRITTETVDRIQAFMNANPGTDAGFIRVYYGSPRP